MENKKTPLLLLAPMATLSHEGLRRTVERYSANMNGLSFCDEYYSEMIHASSLVAGGKFEPYYLRTGPVPEKVVWQLTDGKADSLALAAEKVSFLGGRGVDINMGCSAPEICRQGAGVAWMLKDPEKTCSMIKKVKRALEGGGKPGGKSLRLSVKLRLGGPDFTPDSLCSFADMLVEHGVTRLVLHPRTSKDKFKGVPQWDQAAVLAEHLKTRWGQAVSLCGNGNITDEKTAAAVLQKVPLLEGLMIGRQAVQKPWIFAQIAESFRGSFSEKKTINLRKLGLDFLADLPQCQPEEFLLTRSQRFFAYFCGNFSFGQYVFNKIRNAKSFQEVGEAFLRYFDEMPQEAEITQ